MLAKWTQYLVAATAAFAACVDAAPSNKAIKHKHKHRASALTTPSPIRGVNIGNWLLLEKWMDSTGMFSGAFADAVDQWTFDEIEGAEAALQNHWATWFTETDVALIASWGINMLRIPIGYWAFNNSVTGAPYISGADAYLKQALVWARAHGLGVLIDLHGAPGNQDGWQGSGHTGPCEWQQGNNLEYTTDVLEEITKQYGGPAWADVVWGIELVNEPIAWGNNSFSTTQSWTESTFNSMFSVRPHSAMKIISHDSFMGPNNWLGVSNTLNNGASIADAKFWIDTHLYQNQQASESALDLTQHLQQTCGYSTSVFLPSSDNVPVFVGEFTAQINICADSSGTITSGTSCSTSGCQCTASTDIGSWNSPLKQATRQFWEAQLQTYEGYGQGWITWAYKAPGPWGLANLINNGIINTPFTTYTYPDICNSY